MRPIEFLCASGLSSSLAFINRLRPFAKVATSAHQSGNPAAIVMPLIYHPLARYALTWSRWDAVIRSPVDVAKGDAHEVLRHIYDHIDTSVRPGDFLFARILLAGYLEARVFSAARLSVLGA